LDYKILITKERTYLYKEYIKINYNKESLINFLDEIYSIVSIVTNIKKDTSFLDIGCGRGYFLKYLHEKGLRNLKGIDPCNELLDEKLFNDCIFGSVENNSFNDNSFEIVFTCHTLHHLKEKRPENAIIEMMRIAKKYIIIVEINNTNIPMFLVSLLNYKVERYAYLFNKRKVISMLNSNGYQIVFESNLRSPYISSDSWFYKLLSKIGCPPYNIIISSKK
jgi:ubiquinone/menaquinone biosynthesis C-methylase UbiE